MSVLGPYDRFDWLLMKKIKTNLNWYLQQSPFEAFEKGYRKEQEIYSYLTRKSA